LAIEAKLLIGGGSFDCKYNRVFDYRATRGVEYETLKIYKEQLRFYCSVFQNELQHNHQFGGRVREDLRYLGCVNIGNCDSMEKFAWTLPKTGHYSDYPM
jgi:hypothetical protein